MFVCNSNFEFPVILRDKLNHLLKMYYYTYLSLTATASAQLTFEAERQLYVSNVFALESPFWTQHVFMALEYCQNK
jgi:hypothetical protein